MHDMNHLEESLKMLFSLLY